MAGSAYLRRRGVRDGSLRLDRHSSSGRVGSPKKGGAGAKYVWGVAGIEDQADDTSFMDNMDPNYFDFEEEVQNDREKATK